MTELTNPKRTAGRSSAAVPQVKRSSDRTGWSRPVDLKDALSGKAPPGPTVCTWPDDDGVARALFYPNEVHSVFGDPESMKSWLLLATARQEIKLGHHVFYIDMEANDRSIVDRMRLLGAKVGEIRKRFHYFRPDEPITADDHVAINRLISKHQPTLVVLDGVTEALAMHGLKVNATEDIALWFQNVARRFQVEPTATYAGPAIVELDHVVKDKEARGGWAIGSIHKKAGIKGAAYSMVSVAPFGRGRHGRSRLFLEKDSPGGIEWVTWGKDRRRLVAELHCESGDAVVDAWLESPDVGEAVQARDEVPLVETYNFRLKMQDVCKCIADNPAASMRNIRARVTGTNDVIATAVEQLVQEGYVVNEGTPNRGKYVVERDYIAIQAKPVRGKS